MIIKKKKMEARFIKDLLENEKKKKKRETFIYVYRKSE